MRKAPSGFVRAALFFLAAIALGSGNAPTTPNGGGRPDAVVCVKFGKLGSGCGWFSWRAGMGRDPAAADRQPARRGRRRRRAQSPGEGWSRGKMMRRSEGGTRGPERRPLIWTPPLPIDQGKILSISRRRISSARFSMALVVARASGVVCRWESTISLTASSALCRRFRKER